VSFNAQGGAGCISVTSNIAPKLCARVQDLTLRGDFAEALKLHDTLTELHQAMFLETSPSPVKYATSLLGKCLAEVRLPLVQPADVTKARIKKAVDALLSA
jgi:4-hydroxy-tetrahydrodipicolinate synthase